MMKINYPELPYIIWKFEDGWMTRTHFSFAEDCYAPLYNDLFDMILFFVK